MKAVLTIDLLTLFPQMIHGFLEESIVGRAVSKGIIHLRIHNIRDWAEDKHQTVDDRPFGGGAGMVLKPEPLFAAIEELKTPESRVIYMAPDGDPLTSRTARECAQESHLILISGHYEGIDQRVRDQLVDREISIGDYILTNGTLPAAVLIDALARYIPGVLGQEKSLTQDTFVDNLLSFPQYTRPENFKGYQIPEVLLSGNHQFIAKWRRDRQNEKTKKQRPNLIQKK